MILIFFQLLPQTRRGNIIRKMLAYFNLQVILGLDPPITIALADVQDAARLITLNKAKLALYEDANEYYVLLSIIRMLDVMVGNEPFLDFKQKKHKSIQIIEDYLEKVSGIILLGNLESYAFNFAKIVFTFTYSEVSNKRGVLIMCR